MLDFGRNWRSVVINDGSEITVSMSGDSVCVDVGNSTDVVMLLLDKDIAIEFFKAAALFVEHAKIKGFVHDRT